MSPVLPAAGGSEQLQEGTVRRLAMEHELGGQSADMTPYDATKDGGGVPFEQLPATWTCPTCSSPKAAYMKLTNVDGTVQWFHDETALAQPIKRGSPLSKPAALSLTPVAIDTQISPVQQRLSPSPSRTPSSLTYMDTIVRLATQSRNRSPDHTRSRPAAVVRPAGVEYMDTILRLAQRRGPLISPPLMPAAPHTTRSGASSDALLSMLLRSQASPPSSASSPPATPAPYIVEPLDLSGASATGAASMLGPNLAQKNGSPVAAPGTPASVAPSTPASDFGGVSPLSAMENDLKALLRQAVEESAEVNQESADQESSDEDPAVETANHTEPASHSEIESQHPESRVIVQVLSASGLSKMDRSGKADPYVVLACGPAEAQRSKVTVKTLSPVWDDAVFHFTTVDESDELVVTMLDKDRYELQRSLGELGYGHC